MGIRLRSVEMTQTQAQAISMHSPIGGDEQELVVQISNHQHRIGRNFNDEGSWEEESMVLRRRIILQQMSTVQRANFIHFLVLCLVPTTLLLIVIVAMISEEGECGSTTDLTVCEMEPRSFVNAFTRRCICDALKIVGEEGYIH